MVVQRPSPSQIIYILAEEMMFLNFAFCCCCVVSRVCAMKSLLFCILSFYMSGNVCCGRGSYFFLSQGNRGADSFFVPPNLLEHRKSKNLQDQLSRLSRLSRKPWHLVILGLSLVNSSSWGMRLLAGHGNYCSTKGRE